MKILEKETEAHFIPSMSLIEFTDALLGEEAKDFYRKYRRIVFENRIIDLEIGVYNALIKYISPDAIKGGLVRTTNCNSFSWTAAKNLICQTYGLSTLRYIGTRREVRGFAVASIVNSSDGDKQRERFTAFVTQLKHNNPHVTVVPKSCVEIEKEQKPCDLQPFFEVKSKKAETKFKADEDEEKEGEQ